MHPMYDDEQRGQSGRNGRGQRFGTGRQEQHHGRGIPGRGPGGHGGRGGRGFGPGFGPGAFAGFGPGFAPGFGFGRDGRRARRGDVRLAILSLLSDGPANGYSLIKAIAERTEGAWKPSPGSVYPTLQQLVDEGLITASGDDGRSVYELTEAGKAEVEAQADEIARAWATTPGVSDAHRELFESLRKSAGLLHMYRTSATDEQVRQAAAKIDQLRKDLLQILAD